MRLRIGQGFDVHAFGPGNSIILGGVSIPAPVGIIAHSDGDVLAHSVSDALLGALALGDRGEHFPDTDDQYKNSNSMLLLGQVYNLVLSKGWQLANADITIITQTPRITPYKTKIQTNLANILHSERNQISIKATTTEHLGFTGRREGLAVQTTLLLTGLLQD